LDQNELEHKEPQQTSINNDVNEIVKAKINAEQVAALRSLRTNLYFIAMSFFPNTIRLTSLSTADINFIILFVSSINKCLMVVLVRISTSDVVTSTKKLSKLT
jgi:hypothetical protein